MVLCPVRSRCARALRCLGSFLGTQPLLSSGTTEGLEGGQPLNTVPSWHLSLPPATSPSVSNWMV